MGKKLELQRYRDHLQSAPTSGAIEYSYVDKRNHFFIGKDGAFSSIFDFKQTMLGQEGKGWFDHSLPTADELKESIFLAHERADSIGVLSTIIGESRRASWGVPLYCRRSSKRYQ